MKSREPAANALHAKPVATPETPLTLGCVRRLDSIIGTIADTTKGVAL